MVRSLRDRVRERARDAVPGARGNVALLALCAWFVLQSAAMWAAAAAHAAAAWQDVQTAAVVLVAATISSIAGFAFAALAGIGLAFVTQDPVQAVHTIVLCSIATQLYAVWQLRSQIRLQSIGPMLLAGALTAPFGTWLLLHIDAATYRAGLGAFLIAYGAYCILRRERRTIRATRAGDAIAAALAGFVGGLTAFPGALMTIWCSLQGMDQGRQRATYQPFILVMQVVTAIALHALGRGQLTARHDLRFVVFAIVGAAIGFAWFRRMSAGQFRLVLHGLLVVSGIGLLVASRIANS